MEQFLYTSEDIFGIIQCDVILHIKLNMCKELYTFYLHRIQKLFFLHLCTYLFHIKLYGEHSAIAYSRIHFIYIILFMFSSSTTWDRSTTHPKFDPTGIRTHDLQIMTVHFMSLRRLL